MPGKRSPTAHRTTAQMRQHGREYGGRPEQKKRRAARNKARSAAIASGKARKGDGKDIHHKDNNPRNNSKSNVKVLSRAKNRGHGRSPGGRG